MHEAPIQLDPTVLFAKRRTSTPSLLIVGYNLFSQYYVQDLSPCVKDKVQRKRKELNRHVFILIFIVLMSIPFLCERK